MHKQRDPAKLYETNKCTDRDTELQNMRQTSAQTRRADRQNMGQTTGQTGR